MKRAKRRLCPEECRKREAKRWHRAWESLGIPVAMGKTAIRTARRERRAWLRGKESPAARMHRRAFPMPRQFTSEMIATAVAAYDE